MDLLFDEAADALAIAPDEGRRFFQDLLVDEFVPKLPFDTIISLFNDYVKYMMLNAKDFFSIGKTNKSFL